MPKDSSAFAAAPKIQWPGQGAGPNSFRDPYWAGLATKVSSKQGLPPGLLLGVLTNGERSNADQVSEAGARTPFQVTPTTRNLVLKRDGVDAYLSPENAAEVAGIVLKDGLNWAKGRTDDPDTAAKLAAGYYHGGGDTKNWGPRTEAYVMRVSSGLPAARSEALNNDFAKFMAANPAIPAGSSSAAVSSVAPAGATPVPSNDPLSRDFAKFMAEGGAPRTGAEAIPTAAEEAGQGYMPPVAQPASPAPGLIDRALGAGEAVLNAGTGMAASIVGGAAGVGQDVASLMAGQTPQPGNIERSIGALTYQPRTETGQNYAAGLGQILENVGALSPMTAEMGALARGTAPLVRAAGDATRAAPEVIRAGAPILADKVSGATQALADRARSLMPGSTPAAPTATPGTMGSVGAAGTDVALMRQTAATDLPVPIQLTKGQATRDFAQQQFERETAKNPTAGAPLRDRFAEQNAQMAQNVDAFIDQTGAQAPSLRAAGVAVDDAINKAATSDKNAIKVAYKAAEKAGELEAPVSLDSVVQHLNDNAPQATTAPILKTLRDVAVKLGVAADDSGTLVAKDVPLKTAELFRQNINMATDAAPTNIRQAAILKGLVDDGTAGAGGTAYAQARALRARFAENYERHGAIADITKNKVGTADRKVALEDIHQRMILDGSLDDVRQVRRVLQRAGPDGHQAWKELQGQTLSYIRDQAFGNAARDQLGNSVLSFAKLDKSLKALDASGKLDFVFSKKGAEQLRTVRDVAQDVYTSPPGSVNSSNTASVLAGLMDLGLAYHGLPVPIATGARLLAQKLKDRKLAQRVNDALNGAKKSSGAP